ncbi:MAG TPA: alanine racemase [Caulobacteraceae bacterium]|nr:alanine racemase [Caulobacteraceae bacterium]
MATAREARRAAFIAEGVLALARNREDRGAGGHDAYFAGVQAALARAGIAEPALVVDRARLAANIEAVRDALAPSGLALRVVSKSLQAPALLELIMAGCASERLMVFSGVMLDEVARRYPTADVLLGRPLPALQVDAFIRRRATEPSPASHPQWLVDSAHRFGQYVAIARAANVPIRINLEIDVGLHRGGLADLSALAALLDLAAAEPLVEVTGLMGYDAHVPALGDPKAETGRVKARYADAKALLIARLGGDPARFTFNTAGSPTFMHHLEETPASEVSVGSAFLKPLNYDHGALHALQPAAFIAQPVLKVMQQALIPGIEAHAEALNALDPNSRRGVFLYGGYGDAEPISPPGLGFSPLYGGRSMLSGSDKVEIAQDDMVFFRPRESEGVLLQYGDIAVFDGAEIVERWATFPVHA